MQTNDFGYPLLEKDGNNEEASDFHSLPPPAPPLIPFFHTSFVLFSQETLASIRFKLEGRTQAVQSWFSSNPKRGYRAKKITSLTSIGWRWKEMKITQGVSLYSRKMLGTMNTEWERLSVDDTAEGRGKAAAYRKLSDQGIEHIDGVLDPGNNQRSDRINGDRRGSSGNMWGLEEALAALAAESMSREGVLQMDGTEQVRVGNVSREFPDQQMAGKAPTTALRPLTNPPRRRRRPLKIDWSTPRWGSSSEIASRNSLHNPTLARRRLAEDFPPLSPQVSPRTVPSSPIETLIPSSTLWQHALRVEMNMPMGSNTSPLRPVPSQPPERRSSLDAPRKSTEAARYTPRRSPTARGRFNAKFKSREPPMRTSSMDFACRGSVARVSIFSEDVDPGFNKSTPDKASTWSPGDTIRKTKKVVGRMLTPTLWRNGKGEDRDDNAEGGADFKGSILGRSGYSRKPNRDRKAYYPTPPLSPHPGNRVYNSEGSGMGPSVALTVDVRGAREVYGIEAAEDGFAVEAKFKGKKKLGLKRLMRKT